MLWSKEIAAVRLHPPVAPRGHAVSGIDAKPSTSIDHCAAVATRLSSPTCDAGRTANLRAATAAARSC